MHHLVAALNQICVEFALIKILQLLRVMHEDTRMVRVLYQLDLKYKGLGCRNEWKQFLRFRVNLSVF